MFRALLMLSEPPVERLCRPADIFLNLWMPGINQSINKPGSHSVGIAQTLLTGNDQQADAEHQQAIAPPEPVNGTGAAPANGNGGMPQ